ncbi:MAG: hypothetical protein KGO93_06215 [Cyanobacteria bacterium REEB446]|nr:hypothetical protein [Cyanobacteria bacterium REEB446]
MGAINTAAYLASIRSKMDAQQQVVALLESELQKSILGDSSTKISDLTGLGGSIEEIYSDAGLIDSSGNGVGQGWLDAINSANDGTDGNGGFPASQAIDQDFLRQMLYQARALLGELRIEEQAWNGEVNSEKTLRKEVNDFAKV